MQQTGIAQETLAHCLGCTRGAIGHYLAGRRNPPLRQLESIAAVLGVEPAWLLYGRGAPHDELREGEGKPYLPPAQVPVIGHVGGLATKWRPPLVQPGIHLDRDHYALQVIGTHYMPRLRDGEYVVLDPARKAQVGAEVLVHFRDRSQDLFRLVAEYPGCVVLDSLALPAVRAARERAHVVSLHPVVAVWCAPPPAAGASGE